MLEAGTLVSDRYRIDAVLGEGGMGAVYRAEHVHMHKQVALKVLHPDVSSHPEIRARFAREAMAGAHIDHPNVAVATDFGELADGSFFLVMEYLPGQSLRALLDRGRLDPARALKIARGILAGLSAAHAKGVVHRDLKPENVILVDKDGDSDFVKVLDFGIAKVDPDAIARAENAPASSPLTRLGAIMGTPEYMAPEQALGDPVDHRADFYALGVILYEMLSGKRPYDGGALTLMKAHALLAAPTLPEDLAATLGPGVSPVLQRMMAKLKEDRFASAADLDAALAEVQSAASLPGVVTSSRVAVTAHGAEAAPSATSPTVLAEGVNVRPAPGRTRWKRIAVAGPVVLALVTIGVVVSSRAARGTPEAAPAARADTAADATEDADGAARAAEERPRKRLVPNNEEKRRHFHILWF